MADVVCLALSDMTYDEPLMKSFAGFWQMLVIWRRSRYLVEACGGIFLRAFQMPIQLPTDQSSTLANGDSIKRRHIVHPFVLYPREKKVVALCGVKGPADVD